MLAVDTHTKKKRVHGNPLYFKAHYTLSKLKHLSLSQCKQHHTAPILANQGNKWWIINTQPEVEKPDYPSPKEAKEEVGNPV